MNPAVDDESNIKRLQRLVDEVKIEAADKRHLVLMGRTKVRVSLDRTEWDFGSVTNNLLTAGVETNGLAVPVHTKDLAKCGSSNDDERFQAVDALLEVIPVECIEVLTADRATMPVRCILWSRRISQFTFSGAFVSQRDFVFSTFEKRCHH